VRVNISSIDADIIDSLEVGDNVIVQYSGIVGMSMPPFIAAKALEVVE